MNPKYLIKIVPPWGYRVFRLQFSARQAVLCATLFVAGFGGIGGFYAWQMHHAEARVGELRDLTDSQRTKLDAIDAKAAELDGMLRSLEQQNEQIRRLMGVKGSRTGSDREVSGPHAEREPSRDEERFANVEARIEALRARSASLRADGEHLRTLALHVLNMRHLESLARARMLAAIPSINPSGGGIASGFGWRWDPWPEFHEGVDLEADYGTPVRAAAAGTVVAVGYDGGYGIKVDIDHGNGYHTWYCHLSHADVQSGQYVRKAQLIAESGSTGASTGPHLHYQIMLDGKAIDPVPYLNGVPDKVLARVEKR